MTIKPNAVKDRPSDELVCIYDTEKAVEYIRANRQERNGKWMIELDAIELESLLLETLTILQQNYCYPRK